MIRRIRKTHKIVWLILAVLLPLLFIASIIYRHRVPINENIPKRVQSSNFSLRKFEQSERICRTFERIKFKRVVNRPRSAHGSAN